MSLKHAIIALLDLEPGTGYDLMKRFNSSVGHFWSASHQQLYQELGRLYEAGWVEFDTVPQQGKPDRKVYRPTSAGLIALQDWLAQPVGDYKFRDPLLIKVFAGLHGSRADLRKELARHREAHAATLATYRQIESTAAHLPPALRIRYQLPVMTLRLGIRFEEAWLDWANEMEGVIERLADDFTDQ